MGLRAIVLAALLALGLLVAPGAAPAATTTAAPAAEGHGAGPRQVVLVLDPGGSPTVFEALAARPAFSMAVVGAGQGRYSRRSSLLDLTAGTRVSRSGLRPSTPPAMAVSRAGGGAEVDGWPAVLARARTAPTEIRPGLLAGAVPGGAAFAGVGQGPRLPLDALLAADEHGRIAAVSTGPAATLAERVSRLQAHHGLVVAVLPEGRRRLEVLDALSTARAPGELLLVMRRPPATSVSQQLALGAAGLGGVRSALRSPTTRRDGLVAATDVLPTVLHHLGVAVPGVVQGRAIVAGGPLDTGGLSRLDRRLRVVLGRRAAALVTGLGSLLLLCGALGAPVGPRYGRRERRRRAARVGGLGLLWVPAVSLATAAMSPSLPVELAAVAVLLVLPALLVDRLVPWPAAPVVPALTALVAHGVDLAAGSPLIIRSLLGPNPLYGARFYGIGNELEAVLPVMALVAFAVLADRRRPSRRLALVAGLWLLVVAATIGAGRLGADVGGVITVAAAGAVAVLILAPGRPSRRGIAIAVLAPVAAVLALVALDLLTGGGAHLTSTVVDADGPDAVLRIFARRLQLAWATLTRGLVPVLTLIALGLVALAVRRRALLLAPVADRVGWAAATWGSLTGALVGSVANDSGPVLLLFGGAMLAAALLYVHGGPERARPAAGVRAADPPQG